MIFLYSDYRFFLQDQLQLRKKRNKAYSLRAFAKTLNIPASTLSEVLSQRKNLTDEAVKKVIAGLRLRRDAARFFALLVEKNQVRSASRKKEIERELQSLTSQSQRKVVSAEQKEFLSQGLEFALIELGGIPGVELTTELAARAIGISETSVQEILTKLVSVGALKVTTKGHYIKSGSGVLVASEEMNFNLRKFHVEMLDRAKQSLREQSPKERIVGSETFSFHSSQLAEANELVEDFFSNLVALANRYEHKDSVYHLGVQMFRLTQKGVLPCE